MGIDPKKIMALDRFDYAVSRSFGLFGKGAEQAIPNNEYTGIVSIKVDVIHAVMDAMMRGSVEDILQNAHPLNEGRVYPKLPEQIKSMNGDLHPRRKPEQHQRCVKDPMSHTLKPTLTNCDAQVEMLA